jgi:hypothetical protein
MKQTQKASRESAVVANSGTGYGRSLKVYASAGTQNVLKKCRLSLPRARGAETWQKFFSSALNERFTNPTHASQKE